MEQNIIAVSQVNEYIKFLLAGEVGAGGFIRDDVAGFVQRQLASEQLRGRGASHADEHTVAGKVMFRVGVDIF